MDVPGRGTITARDVKMTLPDGGTWCLPHCVQVGGTIYVPGAEVDLPDGVTVDPQLAWAVYPIVRNGDQTLIVGSPDDGGQYRLFVAVAPVSFPWYVCRSALPRQP